MHPLRFHCTRLVLAALFILAAPFSRAANPFVSPLFTSNMVLQRDTANPVWGWAAPGASVTVQVKDEASVIKETRTVTAGGDGYWQTSIGPYGLVAGNAAYSMTVAASGQSSASFSNILIGDVWLCSGQSNMEFTLSGVTNASAEVAAAAAYTKIRQFVVPRAISATPQANFPLASGGWRTTATDAGGFSAVAYFMAREIHEKTGVPIGIMHSSWGGSRIVSWLPAEVIRTVADYTLPTDRLPAMPEASLDRLATVCVLYNAMMAPLKNLKIKGLLWYQGENSIAYGGPQYSALFKLYREMMRSQFGQPALPIVTVQLCAVGNAQTLPVEGLSAPSTDYGNAPSGGGAYPELREAQALGARAEPDNRLVVTIDCGTTATSYSDIHPTNKQDPGKRAGQAALSAAYHLTDAALSPVFSGATVVGATLRCDFNDVGPGLMVGLKSGINPVTEIPGGTLTGFAVAGANGSYFHATATITADGKSVIVSSPGVAAPVSVRYGWGNNPATTSPSITPKCNLYRKIVDSNGTVVDGVPASPFRNDPVARLSVVGGSGNTYNAQPGATIALQAATAPAGQTFAYWTGDTDALANPLSAATTATLSRPYVSVLANYTLTSAQANFTAIQNVDAQVTLTWNAAANITDYQISRATHPAGPFTVIAGHVLTNSYVDPNLAYGTYYYQLSATSTVGESPPTAPIAAVISPIVSNLAAYPGNHFVRLAWSAPSTAVTTYRVKRGNSASGPFTTLWTGIGTQTFSDYSAENGGTYFYTVSVENSGGEQPDCQPVAAVLPAILPATQAPAAPTGLAAVTEGANTVLTWSASPGASGYQIKRATSAGGPYQTLLANFNGSIFTDPAVNPAITWYYVVSANNSIGESANSAEVNLSYLASRSAGGIVTASSANLPAGTSSPLQAFDGILPVNTENKWWSGNGVTPTPANPAWVQNQFANNAAWAVNEYRVTVADYQPRDPRDWTLQGSDDGSSWTILDSRSAQTFPARYSTINYPIANTTAWRFYRLSVSANYSTNGVSTSNGVAVGEIQLLAAPSPPLAPANLVASPVSDSQIRLDWLDQSTNETAYLTEIAAAGSNQWVVVSGNLPAGSQRSIIAGLNPATAYDFRVKTINGPLVSGFSVVTATTAAGIGDGIPGWWRHQYFGNGLTVIPGTSDPAADPDGDGLSNLQEFLAGTDPTDSRSALKITATGITGSDFSLTFASVSGKKYLAEKSPSLLENSWQTFRDGISGTGNPISITDPGGAAGLKQFYRIRLKP